MYQRGYRYSCEFAEVFVDTKTDMYLFCRAAPFEKLFYILAVITAELVIVFI